jgi:hypothetical protein
MAALALSAVAALAQGSGPSNDASTAMPMSGAPADDSAAGASAAAQSSQTPPPAQPGPDGVVHVTNGPVPDTPASRAANGAPMSNAGQHTAPAGN